jgi:putative endonuclease
MNTRETGARYEQSAARYLRDLGYHILEQNFRSRRGEIDLIATEGEYLVFVEVKYRKDGQMGDGTEAVDARKRHRIVDCARYYLHLHPRLQERPCRFDVVSIFGEEIVLLRDAFWVDT